MKRFLIAMGLLGATPAHADLRELCPDRPGLNAPSCTVDPGHLLAELGMIGWTGDRQASARSDMIITGDMLLRYGIDERTEISLGWTAFGRVRQRDAGGVSAVDGVGDVTLALKRGIGPANGPVALQAYVTAPVGSSAFGAGQWQAGALLPVALPLSNGFEIALTPEIDWLGNSSGTGHHFAFGSAFGIEKSLGPRFGVALEGQVTRDNDPSGHSTAIVSAASLSYQPDDNTQFDIGAVKGVSNAPDVELYFGISRRF